MSYQVKAYLFWSGLTILAMTELLSIGIILFLIVQVIFIPLWRVWMKALFLKEKHGV